jgi:transcription elongation factor
MHSATPGWQAANSSRTPNTYDGARTPAWNASSRRDSYKAIATDSESHELHVNDNVKEIDNEVRSHTCKTISKAFFLLTHSQGRKGRVLHTYQSFFAQP